VGVPIRNTADYSPFGVQLDGRTIQWDFYRFGYQGSEKDDESKGGGNSYTTFFRQLDPRVGRWFCIDPVFQPWQSPYGSMSLNPIINVDPNGDTDFYNKRGKKIGFDGSNNNESYIVLTKSTIKSIKKEMKVNGLADMNIFNPRHFIPIFEGLVSSMETSFSDSETSSHKEEGFAIAKSSSTGKFYTQKAPTGSESGIDWTIAAQKVINNGDILITDAHLHKPDLRYIEEQYLIAGNATPSSDDKINYNNFKTTEPYNISGPCIILGYKVPDIINEMSIIADQAKNNNGKPINLDPTIYNRKIGFFTGNETINISFNKFKKVSNKILRNQNKTNNK
jgi:RHS repeat-associated protein